MLDFLKSIKTIIYSTFVLFSTFELVGCSQDSSSEELSQPHQKKTASLPVHHHEEGQKLLDVAGRSTLPRPEQESSRHYVLNPSEKKMIGRYLVTISCQDPIARCAAGQKGSVEYIINLMADGSVFRLIKSFGKVYADTRNMQGYNNNHWEVVVENQKQYVLISFGQGFRFYFEIDAKGNLIMDSQRNFKINRQFFKQGHPYTLTRYYLVRAAN